MISRLEGVLLASGILGLLAMPSSALAQDSAPPFDGAFDVQLMDYQPGPKTFLSVANGETFGARQFSVDLFTTFITNPFVLYNYNEFTGEVESQRTNVIESLLAGQLIGAYGLTNSLQLSAVLPLVFSMAGQGLDSATGQMSAAGLQASGTGDLRLELKGRLSRSQHLSTAWWVGLSAPTSFGSDGSDFLGDDLPTGRAGLAMQWTSRSGRLTAAANAGILVRKPREIYAAELGQQLTYGAAAAAKATNRFSLVAEIFGRLGIPALNQDTSPAEAAGAMRLLATESMSFVFGAGTGLPIANAVGSPTLRVFAAVGYAPDFRDTDGDGLANQSDKCPLQREDTDGFEDGDGCPDDDNDGDLRDDASDKCPLEREDNDGFDDDDGCPDLDNDNDGIPDEKDHCPNDGEDKVPPYTKDGCPASGRDSDDDGIRDDKDQCPDDHEDDDEFEDWDGCPDLDNDNDGIPDEKDTCPLCAEDIDGHLDDDGCPDLDNDNDGVPDREDQCLTTAETLNGNNDSDGCPDAGSGGIQLEGNRLLVSEPIEFRSNGALRTAGRKTIDQIAQVMRINREVSKWRIVVAVSGSNAESATQEATKRANAIRERLVSRGMPGQSVEAIGTAANREVTAFSVLERSDPDSQEYLCPTQLQVRPRPPPTP